MARSTLVTSLRRRDLGAIEDCDVVLLAVAGDEAAWAELVDRFDGLVMAITRRFRLSRSDAADVSQMSWLQLHRFIGGLREPARVGAWLATTARRECLRVVARWCEEPVDPTMIQEPGTEADPGERIVDQESREAVRRALQRLTPRGRRVVERLVWDEQSYEEISEALSMPIGSIGPTRKRSMATLARSPEVVATIAS